MKHMLVDLDGKYVDGAGFIDLIYIPFSNIYTLCTCYKRQNEVAR